MRWNRCRVVLAVFPLAIACAATTRGASPDAVAAARSRAPDGARVFANECAGCHGNRGQGKGTVPALMGAEALRDPEAFRTAETLFDYVSRSMPLPRDRIGSLKPEQYWAVVNFILLAHQSEVPPGGVTPENAPSVVIQR
jgi:mono/diheme cytochrome c family protein